MVLQPGCQLAVGGIRGVKWEHADYELLDRVMLLSWSCPVSVSAQHTPQSSPSLHLRDDELNRQNHRHIEKQQLSELQLNLIKLLLLDCLSVYFFRAKTESNSIFTCRSLLNPHQ